MSVHREKRLRSGTKGVGDLIAKNGRSEGRSGVRKRKGSVDKASARAIVARRDIVDAE